MFRVLTWRFVQLREARNRRSRVCDQETRRVGNPTRSAGWHRSPRRDRATSALCLAGRSEPLGAEGLAVDAGFQHAFGCGVSEASGAADEDGDVVVDVRGDVLGSEPAGWTTATGG